MKPNFKAILSVFAGACIITASLCGCSQNGTQNGTSRAPGNNMGQGTQNNRYGMVNATTQNSYGYGNTTGNYNGRNYSGLNNNAMTGTNDMYGMYGTNGTNGTNGNGLFGMNGTNNTGMTGMNGTNGTTGMNGTNNTGMTGMNGTNGTTGMNGTNGTTGTLNRLAANRIKTQLKGVKGISDVNCMVLGNTALVSYNCNNNTTALQNSIKQKVKSADSNITNVVCTNDKNVAARMSRLSSNNGSANGMNGTNVTNDINNISTEFNNIINSLTKPITR